MPQIIVDVFDAQGNTVGPGPVLTATSVSVTSALDGAGSISVSFPGRTSRASDLVQNERRVRVTHIDSGGYRRIIGSGILQQIDIAGTASSWTLKSSGPDALNELKRTNVLLRREYREMTLRAVVQALASIAGWTAIVDDPLGDLLVTIRLDGESILKAFQNLSAIYGLHFRQGATQRSLEFGTFGDSVDLTLVNPELATAQLYQNPTVAIISKLAVTRDTRNLVNWILPQGGGEGLAALTLEKSTRTGPYTIHQMLGPDGLYFDYLRNDASIAMYGQIEKVGVFKDISPIDNTDIGIQRAANALYDATASYLDRYSQRLDVFKLSAIKLDITVKPGDKIRLRYRGLVYDDVGLPVDFLDIDEELWVLRVTERFGNTAGTVDFEVATVDRYQEDIATVIIGAIEAIQLRNLKVQPYPSTSISPYSRTMDSTHPARVPIILTDGLLYLDRCRIHFISRPFRATASGTSAAESTVGSTEAAAAVIGSTASGGSVATTSGSGGSSGPTSTSNGDHRHRVTGVIGGSLGTNFAAIGGGMNFRSMQMLDGSGNGVTLVVGIDDSNQGKSLFDFEGSNNHSHTITIPAHTHTINIAAHSHDIEIPEHSHQVTIPAHNHTIAYGIIDDTVRPTNVTVFVDGFDRTAELGGPWAPNGEPIDTSIDIGEYLNTAVGGVRQNHYVEFRCASGQGEIEATIELKITVQSLQTV